MRIVLRVCGVNLFLCYGDAGIRRRDFEEGRHIVAGWHEPLHAPDCAGVADHIGYWSSCSGPFVEATRGRTQGLHRVLGKYLPLLFAGSDILSHVRHAIQLHIL